MAHLGTAAHDACHRIGIQRRGRTAREDPGQRADVERIALRPGLDELREIPVHAHPGRAQDAGHVSGRSGPSRRSCSPGSRPDRPGLPPLITGHVPAGGHDEQV